jgi:hypothetical protein
LDNFDYIEHTWDFHYKVGDFIDGYYSVPVDGDMITMDQENYCMLKVTKVDAVDEVKEVSIVKGPEGVVEQEEDGMIRCPLVPIHGYGFVTIATDTGIHKIKSLVPVHDRDSVQFIMGKIVARPL